MVEGQYFTIYADVSEEPVHMHLGRFLWLMGSEVLIFAGDLFTRCPAALENADEEWRVPRSLWHAENLVYSGRSLSGRSAEPNGAPTNPAAMYCTRSSQGSPAQHAPPTLTHTLSLSLGSAHPTNSCCLFPTPNSNNGEEMEIPSGLFVGLPR